MKSLQKEDGRNCDDETTYYLVDELIRNFDDESLQINYVRNNDRNKQQGVMEPVEEYRGLLFMVQRE